jgi:ATP/ADP translocase
MSNVFSNIVSKVIRTLWGDMTKDEIKRFFILAVTYFFLIGAYWEIRVMKNAVFDIFVGYRYQPFAKMVSWAVIILVTLFYSKLLDFFKRDILFYMVATFFGIGFISLGYFISHPEMVSFSANSTMSGFFSFIPGNPSKLLGWIAYCFIEAYGSIVPALFLSIMASTVSTEAAKKGYGMVYTFAQLGLVVGTVFVSIYLKVIGIGILFAIGGAAVCILPFFMRWYVNHSPITPVEKIEAAHHKEQKTGMLEGLKLILSRPYVAGLLVISVIYEAINTIVEFQMNTCALQIYPTKLDGGAAFGWFSALNGMSVGIISLTFAILGTGFFMRKFGMKFCIMSYPSIMGLMVTSILFFYMFGASTYFLMWVFFVIAVTFKGLQYTLNVPAKEVMYIPTSKDVKFKAKSWIDGFGGRSSKTLGTAVTGTIGGNFPLLLIFGTIASLGVIAFWIFVAAYVGNTFNKLQKENKIIE